MIYGLKQPGIKSYRKSWRNRERYSLNSHASAKRKRRLFSQETLLTKFEDLIQCLLCSMPERFMQFRKVGGGGQIDF